MNKKIPLFILAPLAGLLLPACSPSGSPLAEGARRGGYEPVTVLTVNFFRPAASGCSADDRVAYLMAGRRRGQFVTFVLCCGPARPGCGVPD